MSRRKKFTRILVGLTLLTVIITLSLFGSSLYFLNQMFTNRVERLVTTPQELGMPGESIPLTSADGIPLKAWWVPVETPRGIVIVLHGMDGQDASTMLGHAEFLHDTDYAVMALDMRAHGRSGGERIGLANAAEGQVDLWIVEGADHFIYTKDGAAPEDAFYRERILTFLDDNLAGAE